MTEIQKKVLGYVASRHPDAPYSSINALADAWLAEAGANAQLLLSDPALAATRDAFAAVAEQANPDLLAKPAAAVATPVGKRPLKDLSVEEQRALVAEKFGIPLGKLLASDFVRLRNAIIANEAAPPPAPPRPKKGGPPVQQPRVINGMRVDSDEFQKLPPQERIRLARAAQKSG